MAAFRSYNPRDGFYMRFANGEGVSVIWHEGAYADCGEHTAEIMAPFERLGGDFNEDSIRGHVTPDEVAAIMAKTAALPRRKQ